MNPRTIWGLIVAPQKIELQNPTKLNLLLTVVLSFQFFPRVAILLQMLSLPLDRQDSRTQHQEPNEAARSLLAEHQAIAISFFLAIAIPYVYKIFYMICSIISLSICKWNIIWNIRWLRLMRMIAVQLVSCNTLQQHMIKTGVPSSGLGRC